MVHLVIQSLLMTSARGTVEVAHYCNFEVVASSHLTNQKTKNLIKKKVKR